VALVGNGQGQSLKGTKIIEGFYKQVSTRGECWTRRRNVVEHQKNLLTKRFKPWVLRPICRPIQSVGKKIS
jgi:hypothetical protein